MTVEEAIRIVKDDALYNPEAAKICIKALEKQKPKKVIRPAWEWQAKRCPVCSGDISRDGVRFCERCGQKLDWSDKVREGEIKPCPFCGSSNVQKNVSSSGKETIFRCKSCGAYVDFWDCGMPGELEAVEMWNRRVKSDD